MCQRSLPRAVVQVTDGQSHTSSCIAKMAWTGNITENWVPLGSVFIKFLPK